jgi:hypothetical protein
MCQNIFSESVKKVKLNSRGEMGGKLPVDAGFIYDKSFCDTSFTEVHDKGTLYLWCGLKIDFLFTSDN